DREVDQHLAELAPVARLDQVANLGLEETSKHGGPPASVAAMGWVSGLRGWRRLRGMQANGDGGGKGVVLGSRDGGGGGGGVGGWGRWGGGGGVAAGDGGGGARRPAPRPRGVTGKASEGERVGRCGVALEDSSPSVPGPVGGRRGVWEGMRCARPYGWNGGA